MKKLIISIKTSNDSLSDFSRALKKARKGKLKEDHFELSFDNKIDFDRFFDPWLFEQEIPIKIKSETISGRRVKKPVVEYDHIEFDLRAA